MLQPTRRSPITILAPSPCATKDFAAAKENFEKGLAANPDYAYNKVGLGELALMNGDTKTAESYFDEAKKVNKKDAGVLSAIGRAYFNADPVKYAKEIEKYDAQAIKADKKEPAIFVLRGDRKAAEKEWGDAARQLRERNPLF